MLIHRSGTKYEDMHWVDAENISIVAEEINNKKEEEVTYSESTVRKIQNRKGLITLHTHPSSFPPSIRDLNSNYSNNYGIGIVICHNGTVYLYSSEQLINEDYYKLTVEEYIKNGYNENEAQIEALKELMG